MSASSSGERPVAARLSALGFLRAALAVALLWSQAQAFSIVGTRQLTPSDALGAEAEVYAYRDDGSMEAGTGGYISRVELHDSIVGAGAVLRAYVDDEASTQAEIDLGLLFGCGSRAAASSGSGGWETTWARWDRSVSAATAARVRLQLPIPFSSSVRLTLSLSNITGLAPVLVHVLGFADISQVDIGAQQYALARSPRLRVHAVRQMVLPAQRIELFSSVDSGRNQSGLVVMSTVRMTAPNRSFMA